MDILERNKDITELSNYKTEARASFYYELSSEKQLKELYEVIEWAKKKKLPILWVSGGTNMLFAFDVYKGIVIKNSLIGWTYDDKTCLLKTYGAESIWKISEVLERELGQGLWHRFIGLPGSVAGAIYGNAGCFGLEIENNFLSCRVMDLDSGEESVIGKEEMNFAYRSSVLKKQKKYFIISAVFDLSQKREKYHSDVDNIDFRENKQPKGNSCGSFFKNPSREYSAGYLIESVGLKGKEAGGAVFSDIHANFLMNTGQASYEDMLSLIKLAQSRVKDKFNIELINEVQIITNG